MPGASEGVLDRMWWVSALLAAEAPLAGGVARAAGHPGSVLVGRCCCFTDRRFKLDHVRRHEPPAPRAKHKIHSFLKPLFTYKDEYIKTSYNLTLTIFDCIVKKYC